MTFNFAPWAIDGARSAAGLARLASYAAGGGRSGVVKPGDLRVTALAVPGNGVRIASGGATVLNHYLSDPDEAYVVSNPASHTVLETDMPSPQPGLAYYLVCIVVGDPEFNQTGHPYMPPGLLDPAEAPDFEYVRVVIVPCNAGTTRFEELGYNYPAYALARLEVPANTSTITNAMITDLRELAQARSHREVFMGTTAAMQHLHSTVWTPWPGFNPTVFVPRWATRVMMTISLDGAWVIDGSVNGGLAALFGGLQGATLAYDVDSLNYSRFGFRVSVGADISAYAGTSQLLQLHGYKDPASAAGFLSTWDGGMTQVVYDVQFYEDIV